VRFSSFTSNRPASLLGEKAAAKFLTGPGNASLTAQYRAAQPNGRIRVSSFSAGVSPNMKGFRVVYSQGSFALSLDFETQEQAMLRAQSLHNKAGVWHVHVEDAWGNRLAYGVYEQPRLPCGKVRFFAAPATPLFWWAPIRRVRRRAEGNPASSIGASNR